MCHGHGEGLLVPEKGRAHEASCRHDLQANSREQGGLSQVYLREKDSCFEQRSPLELESSPSQKAQTSQDAWSERGSSRQGLS